MTFYQELQLNQAGSKNLLKKSETLKEKLYHMWVYLVKIAATMAFCFFFVSIFSILFGNENSIVGVVVLLCLMVFRNADLVRLRLQPYERHRRHDRQSADAGCQPDQAVHYGRRLRKLRSALRNIRCRYPEQLSQSYDYC